ncbi:MAG: hypothetical protein K6L76_01515 [Agarilytica sp.]
MLNSANNSIKTIAGNFGGYKVRCSTQAFAVYEQLRLKSGNANHWASMIVRGIRGLSNGIINSDDVFVSSGANFGGMQDFTVILPGCTVHAQKYDSGEYFISKIDPSLEYHKAQESFLVPGMHRAYKEDSRWSTKFKSQNDVESKNDINVVGVSDSDLPKVDKVASLVGERAKSISPAIENTGYDLFFTPGKKKIGGLLNYKQAIKSKSDSELHESAILLAEAMKNARKQKNITWFADRGGSGILTQAMHILGRHNIQLAGHKMYLYHPTTSKDEAYKASQKLGMEVSRDFVKSHSLNVNELIGASSLRLPFKRWRNSSDNYTGINALVDYGRGVSGGQGIWNKGNAMLGAAAGAVAVFAPASVTIGAVVAAAKVGAVAAPVVMAHMPNTMDRLNAMK